MWVYLATELSDTKQNLDEDEIIEVVKISLQEALEMISDGEIQDAKTIIALLLTASRMKSLTADGYPAV
jgi:ADP-ribose pyrophosphatase